MRSPCRAWWWPPVVLRTRRGATGGGSRLSKTAKLDSRAGSPGPRGLGLKSNEDARMHIHVFAPPSMLCPSLWMEPGWSNAKNIIPVTAHPCRILLLADGALVERAGRSRRADRDAPNESSVAQLGAELWPETCFGRMCIQNVVALDDHPCMHNRPSS